MATWHTGVAAVATTTSMVKVSVTWIVGDRTGVAQVTTADGVIGTVFKSR